MAWKSRIGKLPPANYYAQIMAYLAMAYPEAEVSQRTMAVLKPIWDRLWQDGRSADIVAKTTCSCDGKSITASPAMDLAKLPRGAVRAPTKTDRGQLFDPTRMRESVETEKAKRQARQLEAQIGKITTRTSRLSSKAARARSDAARAPVLAELEKRKKELERKQAEAAQLAERLAELRKQIGKVGIQLALLSHPQVPFASGAASSVPALVVWRRGRVGNAARNQGVTAFAIRLRSVAMEVGLCRCGISAVRTISPFPGFPLRS